MDGWTEPELLAASINSERQRDDAAAPAVAFDSDDDPCLAWIADRGASMALGVDCMKDSPRDVTVMIDEVLDGGTLSDLQMSANGSGDVALIWLRADNGGKKHVFVSRRKPDSAWHAPRRLDTLDGTAASPRIALDAAGDGLAVWCQSDGTHARVFSSRLD
jgi:hypothetical protein